MPEVSYNNELGCGCWNAEGQSRKWLVGNTRRDPKFWRELAPEWTRHCAFDADFSRSGVLVELVFFVARELDLTLEELQTTHPSWPAYVAHLKLSGHGKTEPVRS